jgi:hypothetical protein
MHEIKIGVFQKVYKHVFKHLYSIIMPRLAERRVSPHNENIQRQQVSSHELRYEMKRISKLSKSTTSIRTSISTKTSVYKLARHHLKESNKYLRCVLCQMLTYATKNSVCTSE